MYIPEDILSKFTKGEIAFRIHNDIQYKIILNNVERVTDYEYDKNFLMYSSTKIMSWMNQEI